MAGHGQELGCAGAVTAERAVGHLCGETLSQQPIPVQAPFLFLLHSKAVHGSSPSSAFSSGLKFDSLHRPPHWEIINILNYHNFNARCM